MEFKIANDDNNNLFSTYRRVKEAPKGLENGAAQRRKRAENPFRDANNEMFREEKNIVGDERKNKRQQMKTNDKLSK